MKTLSNIESHAIIGGFIQNAPSAVIGMGMGFARGFQAGLAGEPGVTPIKSEMTGSKKQAPQGKKDNTSKK